MTPIAAMIRFLTVGSWPFNAASSFKSRTGFESFDDMVGKELVVTGGLGSLEMDGEFELPLATTISVLFCMFPNVGIVKLELPPNGVIGLFGIEVLDASVVDSTSEENDEADKLFSQSFEIDKLAFEIFAEAAVDPFSCTIPESVVINHHF